MVNRVNLAIIYLFVGLAEVFLLVRAVMRFFAANNNNGFIHWVYSSSNILMEPLRGTFTTVTVGHDHTVDFAALFAMVVYSTVAMIFVALFSFFHRWPANRSK